MKRFKKILTICLAAMIAVSAMSISALADTSYNPSSEIYSMSQEETRSRGFEIIGEDIYDLNGSLLIDMTDGFTPDGYTLDPEFKISAVSANASSPIITRKTSICNATYSLPLNTDGKQGMDVGATFKLTSSEPDVYAKYTSGAATAVNFGLVNVNRNSLVDWLPSVLPGDDGYLNGYASNDTFKVTASAQNTAGNARLLCYTAIDPEN